jgi:hypothetical protein
VVLADDSGRVTAFVVVITTACLLFAGLVLDGGFALAAKSQAIGQAEEAARAGAEQLDLTAYRDGGPLRLQPQAASTAAYQYLSSVGAAGTVTIAGNSVTVVVVVHQPTRLLGLIGISDLTIIGRGTAEPDQGQTP